MGETIEQRGRQLFVAGKDGDPFSEGEIRGDDGRSPLVAVGEEIEEQLAADAVERDEAELVDDEDVDTQEPLLQPRERAGIAGFEELLHQIGRSGKQDAAFLFRRLHAERNRQMRFAGADRPGEESDSPGAVTQSPLARAWICVALTPSAAAKSNVSSVLTSGKRASRKRWRMTDSCRDASSALRTSCK